MYTSNELRGDGGTAIVCFPTVRVPGCTSHPVETVIVPGTAGAHELLTSDK